MGKDRLFVIMLAIFLCFTDPLFCFGMEGPGDGEPGWYYGQDNYHWSYYDKDQKRHTGWLNYNGEWYWFNSEGWMTGGGITVVDGVSYYFFINGHMAWNQYVGMKFYDQDGQHDPKQDVRVIGKEKADGEDKDLFSDFMYQIPRSWISRFVEDGWELMFYKQKKYFSAPRTNKGIYYVYHSVDTRYKKVKFTDVDSVLQGFGEYVGYASGCYEEGNSRMEILWEEQPAVLSVLGLPDKYQGDAQFYFGKLFAAYLDGDTKKELLQASFRACQVMEEILHLQDDAETRERLQKKAEEEQKEARERAHKLAEQEGQGPGVEKITDDHN
ncbi:MAG: hypothetical protein HFG54_03695 [Lachnospiraceae bacterium]|nr:hypothetical protein [Lachnospiraceae bacterium]